MVSRVFLRHRDVAWPFRASWGVSLVMILGGMFDLFHLISPVLNLTVVALGVLACAWFLLYDARTHPETFRQKILGSPDWVILLACLSLLCLGTHVHSLYPAPWNANDDSLAYAAFPKKMLDTGCLIEPFSWRRLTGFGGYDYLHSLMLSVLPAISLHLLDAGVMNTLTAFCLAYYVRRHLRASPLIAGVAGLAFAVFALPRINLAPSSILSLLSLSLLHAVKTAGNKLEQKDWRPSVLIALAAAGLISVRVTGVGFAAVFLGLAFLCSCRQSRALVPPIRYWVRVAGIVAVLILPWALSLYRSSGTLLWPAMAGNFCSTIPNSRSLALGAELSFQWKNFCFSGLEYIALFAMLGFLPILEVAYVAGTLLVALITIHSANLAPPGELMRYYAPFTQVSAILVGASVVGWLAVRLPKPTTLISVVLAATICVSVALVDPRWNVVIGILGRFATVPIFAEPNPYSEAIAHIPPGAKILAEVDQPYLFDYRRHTIYNIDQIGMASPGQGLALRGEPDMLIDYLRSQGIGYLVFVRPSKAVSLYSRRDQEKNLSGSNVFYRAVAQNYIWFFDAIDSLSKRYPILFENDRAVVMQIPTK
jgi:hypothetical protein